VYAVAARGRPDQKHRGARLFGAGARQLIFLHNADGHGIDQRVSRVRRGKLNLAANVGHSEAVSVVTHASHHTIGKEPVACHIQGTETQRIEHRHGSGAHGEDVAKDTTHTRGRALVGFDRRGVIVRLNLEYHAQSVADVHRARVFLAGFRKQRLAFAGKRLEQGD
jgi:hypothetical protein